jgi:hypothetical protein
MLPCVQPNRPFFDEFIRTGLSIKLAITLLDCGRMFGETMWSGATGRLDTAHAEGRVRCPAHPGRRS